MHSFFPFLIIWRHYTSAFPAIKEGWFLQQKYGKKLASILIEKIKTFLYIKEFKKEWVAMQIALMILSLHKFILISSPYICTALRAPIYFSSGFSTSLITGQNLLIQISSDSYILWIVIQNPRRYSYSLLMRSQNTTTVKHTVYNYTPKK